jgi:hypothetical protein
MMKELAMKNRVFSVIFFLILLVSLTGNAQATPPAIGNPPALVYVELYRPDDLSRFASSQLPVYASLDGGLLTGANQAGQQSLVTAGLSFQVLDPDMTSGTYYLAKTRSTRPAPDYAAYGLVLLNTSNDVLLRMQPTQVDRLSLAGAELRAITLTPKPIPSQQSEQVIPNVVEPDPLIQGMIDQVYQTEVYTYDRQLAGELPVWVDGAWYTIPTRDTYSGTPIQKTTNFVGQHMSGLGMDVEYHNWGGTTYPNVIGEITGSTNPDDIYMIGAHIDDVPGAPGADDNASGSVATLLAADILSQYQWGCTLRFAFWTGEEQGLLGSSYYAQRAYNQSENILGYLNLDMIAWNTLDSEPYITLAYSTGLPDTQLLAQLYTDVIAAYNIDLIPDYAPNMWGSDHNSFWDYGFTSILAIEDDIHGDFNPYYHSSQDTPAHTNPVYFTDFTKASIATFAHMTGCLIPPGEGALDGHVTAATGGAPLAGASVVADDGQGNTYPTTTDASGYYTFTLPADTYTVTASLDGFIPLSQAATITTGQITPLDFALESVCTPVTGLDFSWLPLEPFNGDLITFSATASGTLPIDFQWDFGDTYTTTGETVTHAYLNAGTYPVILDAGNACGADEINHEITVGLQTFKFFLPLLNRQ